MAKIYDDPNHQYKWDEPRPILWQEGDFYIVPSARGDGFLANAKDWGKLSGEVHSNMIAAIREIEEALEG